MNLNNYIRDIPDFPKKGIIFKDITNLLNNKKAFAFTIQKLKNRIINKNITHIIGVESRGFILGSSLAILLNCGFVPIRKKGKLPHKVYSESYNLEYGKDALEIHKDALKPESNVILIDDVLATGGTINASIKLLKNFSINIVECQFLLEIKTLQGNKKIIESNIDYYSIIKV